MAINYETLKANYPTQDRVTLFNNLEGQWPSLINDENYENTCAIRLSIALRKSGVEIIPRYKEAIDGNGEVIVLKVKTLKELIISKLGDPNWGMSKPENTPVELSDLPARKGIIAYHSNLWEDATGHFDLWTGQKFIGSGRLEDVEDGFQIEMWFL